MAKKTKPNSNRSKDKQKTATLWGSRSPIRISVDRDALAALDKRALATQAGTGIAAGWLAIWLVGGSGLLTT